MKTLLLSAVLLFAQSEVHTQLIRSIKFENFKGISTDEVTHRFKDRGVRVAVEQFYEPKQVEAARQVLEELLEEKGRKGMGVKVDVRTLPPASVEVTFRAVKN